MHVKRSRARLRAGGRGGVLLWLVCAACATTPSKDRELRRQGGGADAGVARAPADASPADQRVRGDVGAASRDAPPPPVCGDGRVEGGEQCEEGVPFSASCRVWGFAGGELRCTSCRWDTSGCTGRARELYRRRRGSCPYLYLWDGQRYAYHTDLSGSVLGHGIRFFKPEYYGENVYELGGFEPRRGAYRLRLREVIYESSFVDALTLLVVELPAGYEVYNRWSFTSQLDRSPSVAFMTARRPRPPLSAVDERGQDVRAAVRAADGVPLPVRPDQLSRVTVDFGAIAHPEHAKLIITAWGFYDDLRREQKPPYSAGTTIETRDAQGRWRVRVVGGKAAGDARTWAVDLAGVLVRDDTRMRITMAHLPSVLDVLDAVALDDSAPVPIRVTRVAPRRAVLRYGGAARVQASSLSARTQADNSRLPRLPGAVLRGRYTRYGDVRPLLARADDRFAIMAHGDELDLVFGDPADGAAVRGSRQVAFLSAHVFYTLKYHPFAVLTDTIEPLPYHGMKTYPYPASTWPYRDDAAYREYLATWNTRELP